MKLNDAFPSKYLKAGDLPEDGSLPVTIEKIQVEEVGARKDQKIVVHFEELDKGMVCNKTNAKTIARILQSDDLDDWAGGKIALYRTEVEFQGDLVEAIRVKKSSTTVQPTKSKTTIQEDDDIPF